ncbi:ATP-binding protein (plasmid) [Embleya sp. NBC_00888]|uniref:hypothetical protein n=1 Tax=Embleya sp. NBC_00888 TaxID=2975960 RepID=UPI002F919CB9|nr:ATP-binding protein [Embleya sp. NBC_00888]
MRIALYGPSGAGKSTSRSILVDTFAHLGHPAVALRLAEPLYLLQNVVRAVARMPLADPAAQDGALLAALGEHLRRINPNCLVEDFAQRLHAATTAHPNTVVICDDMRAPDAQALDRLEFTFVQVTAPDAARTARLAARGDVSAADHNHPTEAPITRPADHVLVNDASIERLRDDIRSLAETLLARRDTPR